KFAQYCARPPAFVRPVPLEFVRPSQPQYAPIGWLLLRQARLASDCIILSTDCYWKREYINFANVSCYKIIDKACPLAEAFLALPRSQMEGIFVEAERRPLRVRRSAYLVEPHRLDPRRQAEPGAQTVTSLPPTRSWWQSMSTMKTRATALARTGPVPAQNF